VSRPVFGVPLLPTIVRRITWLPAAAVIALPFFTPGSPVSVVPVAMQTQQLTISGSIAGLHDGASSGLALTLDNGSDAPSEVHSITVRVTGASDGCPTTALSARTWAGTLVVPPHGSGQAVVPVTLHDADGRCGNATWQLAYTSS
jgi:hypothetical protein